mmetsp:Transcript_58301/g.133790  ORF Transcript_58301/g.133790 Transcript_58301/m.133790 type:complete len:227 (+) Transcript_58301:464-1144(+)
MHSAPTPLARARPARRRGQGARPARRRGQHCSRLLHRSSRGALRKTVGAGGEMRKTSLCEALAQIGSQSSSYECGQWAKPQAARAQASRSARSARLSAAATGRVCVGRLSAPGLRGSRRAVGSFCGYLTSVLVHAPGGARSRSIPMSGCAGACTRASHRRRCRRSRRGMWSTSPSRRATTALRALCASPSPPHRNRTRRCCTSCALGAAMSSAAVTARGTGALCRA